MNLKIENIPPYKVAYIRQYGPYGVNNFKIINALKSFSICNKLFKDDCIILGITYDDPQNTKPEDCRYDACIVVDGNYSLNEKQKSFNFENNDYIIREGNINSGKYAVINIEHTSEAIEKAWKNLFFYLKRKSFKI